MYTYTYFPNGNRWLSTRSAVYRTDKEKVIGCYVDENFASDWDQADADNAENVMSCTRYIITYAGYPVLWCSKLQP